MNKLSETALSLVGQPMFKIKEKATELARRGRSLIHMELGDPEFPIADNLKKIINEQIKINNTHYTSPWGDLRFREAIKESIQKSFGLRLSLDQIVALPGANSGIYWAIRVIANTGDEVLMPDPGFPSFVAAAKAAGVVPVKYGLIADNGYQINISEIRRLITPRTRLIIVNSPSNPVGSVLGHDALKELYEVAYTNGIYVLSDETYRRMMLDATDAQAPSICDYDSCEVNTMMLSSLSKEYSMSGLRLGYIVAPTDVAKKIALYIETVNSCAPPFLQVAGAEALLGSQKDRKANLAELKRRRDRLVEGLNSVKGIKCNVPMAGMYVFPEVSGSGLSGDEFTERMLEKTGIVSVPGSAFGDNSTENVRFSLNVSLDQIEKVVDLMKCEFGETNEAF